MIGLVLIAVLGLVFVAAFWWALPHDANPWPFGRTGAGIPYRSGFGEIETHRALEKARAAAEAMQHAEREASGEEEPGASWMDQPGAFGDEPADEREPAGPSARHHGHREWDDDLPSAEDIARFGGEPDFGDPTSAVDENADTPAHVVAEDDENADIPGDDGVRRTE